MPTSAETLQNHSTTSRHFLTAKHHTEVHCDSAMLKYVCRPFPPVFRKVAPLQHLCDRSPLFSVHRWHLQSLQAFSFENKAVLLSMTLNWCHFVIIFSDLAHTSSGFWSTISEKKTSPGSKTTRSEWHVKCASWVCAFRVYSLEMPQNDGCTVHEEKEKSLKEDSLFV